MLNLLVLVRKGSLTVHDASSCNGETHMNCIGKGCAWKGNDASLQYLSMLRNLTSATWPYFTLS